MNSLQEVSIDPLDPERFGSVLSQENFDRFEDAIGDARSFLEGRDIFNVNSTARGGGVAEMLRSLLAYAGGAGVDARWLVIKGTPEFFRITKRIHNNLHGAPGDGGPLGDDERATYETVLEDNGKELASLVGDRDVVILHDPQTAGLAPILADAGVSVIWRCHVGLDMPNDIARTAWKFLIPYVERSDAYVFSREAYEWEGLDKSKASVIPPSIDAFSPKNQDMDEPQMRAILVKAGIITGDGDASPTYVRVNGEKADVENSADVLGVGTVPKDARMIVQVSRWDRLKDPTGVMEGFASHIAPNSDAHLVLAGPAVEAVADDPEGAEVLEEARAVYEGFSDDVKGRAHLACLPMEDGQENAAIVNALQRRADVIVQKSLAEGFGLTVAEGMWKARPVVASRIGGIQDQIIDGETGILVDDPKDLAAYGAAVVGLLDDHDRAARIGRNAQERVRDEFLGPRHLMQYLELIHKLD